MLGRLLHKKGDKQARQEKKAGKQGREPGMGCSSSQPATKEHSQGGTGSRSGAAQRKPAASADPSVPDVGLTDTHTYVKFLGRGGTGDAHLYEDKADGQRVAIKLMKRPLPKVIMPNILREIKVRPGRIAARRAGVSGQSPNRVQTPICWPALAAQAAAPWLRPWTCTPARLSRAALARSRRTWARGTSTSSRPRRSC